MAAKRRARIVEIPVDASLTAHPNISAKNHESQKLIAHMNMK